MLDFLSTFFVGHPPIMFFSHLLVGAAWSVALFKIWQYRDAPMSHQAFAAALAIVLGEFTLIFSDSLPIEVVTFFLAMAQIVMSISVVKLFRWTLNVIEYKHPVIESGTMTLAGEVSAVTQALKTYGSSILIAFTSGLVYFLITLIFT